MKCITHVFAVIMFAALSASGQKLDSYMHDMGEALAPYATMTSGNCHRVVIDIRDRWGDFAIIDGTNKDKPDEPTGTILKFDILQISVDLAALDEDNVKKLGLFSLDYVTKHEKGTPLVPDTPALLISTSGLNSKMTMHTIDLAKAHALSGQKNITGSDLGLTVVERKVAFLPFSDQQHADVFQKAIQKAIVICKAQ